MLEQPPLGGCAGKGCAKLGSCQAVLCHRIWMDNPLSLGVQIADITSGASREEPREPYIMFADPKPYLVRRVKKAPWEKVEERLKRG